MVPNGKEWYCLAEKKLSALLRETISKHHSDFYYLNNLNSFATEKKRKSHKKVCENKDLCNTIMPSEDTILLEFNQYQKFDETPFIIYVDLICLIENIDRCKNNLENLWTTKASKHILSGFPMFTISTF